MQYVNILLKLLSMLTIKVSRKEFQLKFRRYNICIKALLGIITMTSHLKSMGMAPTLFENLKP